MKRKILSVSPPQFKTENTSPISPKQSNLDKTLESEVRGYVLTFPTVVQKAQGSILTDTQSKEFIDFFCRSGSLKYGLNNPSVKKALLEYIKSDGVQHSLDTATQAKLDFLSAFEKVILKPRGLEYKIQFTGPTGANAVEAKPDLLS